MRQYLQGTLDFACGVYAVINTLSLTYDLSLPAGRRIFAETLCDISLYPELKRAFFFNETDHYWVIKYCLARYAMNYPLKLDVLQPFGNSLVPSFNDVNAGTFIHSLYVEREIPPNERFENNLKSWNALAKWFSPLNIHRRKRAAIFRIHRFLPGVSDPVISHWTTGARMTGEELYLFDSSSEKNASHKIKRDDLSIGNDGNVSLYTVPSSIVFLQSSS